MLAEAKEIKIELLRHNLTQRKLAQHLGMGETQLSAILCQARPVSRDILRQIREAIKELSGSQPETGR